MPNLLELSRRPARSVGPRRGTFQANQTTPVVVPCAGISDQDVILFSWKSGTRGAGSPLPFVSTITPGTSFAITSIAADVAFYNWILL